MKVSGDSVKTFWALILKADNLRYMHHKYTTSKDRPIKSPSAKERDIEDLLQAGFSLIQIMRELNIINSISLIDN